jgi:zinc protease
MKRFKSFLVFTLIALPLSACAPQAERIASASAAPAEEPDWAFATSDIPLDPGYRFGKLANGMRYVIRKNGRPKGTAIVRMEIAAGSLDETKDERGYAHFIEHMAFNGSTNVPEGEMVRLLERHGLAFGADNNASTSFERTVYMLDLPRNDPKVLDIALMLMRETASELTFNPQAVDRERGVVLSELRDRNSYALRNAIADTKFLHPRALYPDRFAIGVPETLNVATADALKAFYKREYVPAHATVIVVGDFDPELVEQQIVEKFASWKATPAQPQPSAGPVNIKDDPRTDVYLDPALAERVVASRHGRFLAEPDSVAQRQENLLRQIGYAIINRRLQRVSRQADPPFRGAGVGTGDVFKAGRTTRLIVDTPDGKWRRGLSAAVVEYRRALKFGFSELEVAEQVANIRMSAQNAAGAANPRSNNALANADFDLLHDRIVPSDPRTVLERLELFIPQITPDRVLTALEREALPLKDPLLRFQGRIAPEGGKRAIREAWKQAMRADLARSDFTASSGFGYTDFGAAGAIISDRRDPALGIREIRFANGVMLNIKPTDIEKDRIQIQMSVDGGEKINTKANPLATQLVRYIPIGGLGKHSEDDLQSILAGHTVGDSIFSTDETFVMRAVTTPRDLELQLQLFAAYLSDPGYRPEGEVEYRMQINNFFAQLKATPGSALRNAIGGILSNEDPRFSLQKVDDYRKRTFAQLKTDISDRLKNGAIEVGVVGDVEEDKVIALGGTTLGALPRREGDFKLYADQPPRKFTNNRNRRVIRHTGPADQAVLTLVWPTRDDSDPVETQQLELLERIVRIELTETLREKLGKAYSPGASSSLSRSWKDYGTFEIAASIDVHEIKPTLEAIEETIAELRATPVSDDLLLRARLPMLESHDNALKSNGGWMSLVDRAQTEPDRIDRYLKGKDRLAALTALDIQAMALRYLDPKQAVEVLVLPEGVDAPKP